MKKGQGYGIRFNATMSQFRFTSTGPKGDIEKIIVYSRFQKNRWNLAFGDIKDDDWTDNIVSDNDDMRIVLQTVVNTVHLFFEKHLDQEVYIEPLDKQRKILYNRIFQQKWSEIKPLFDVKAQENSRAFEEYNPQKIYDCFLIALKKEILE